MVRSLLFVLFLSLAASGNAQLTYNPDPFSIVVATLEDNYSYTKEKLNFTVNTDTLYTIYWKMEFPNMKEKWEVQLCDLNLCYDFNARQSSPSLSMSNKMDKGTHSFEIGFYPRTVPGTGKAVLKLYGDNQFTKLIKEIDINLYAGTTSSKDVNVNTIRVFPNPTTDYFQIANGSQVSKIVLYNVLGKEVKTFFNYNNANHDVSDLRKGIYMVRMLDAKNRVIKTVRLSKNVDGV
jgi:hypothetical protein